MASALNLVYSIAVLLVGLGGIVFLLMRGTEQSLGESGWSPWGELVAVAVFLLAMVGSIALA